MRNGILPSLVVTAASILLSSSALAQSENDLPDDIFADPTTTAPTIAQEKQQLLNEADAPKTNLPEEKREKRNILTLQRKSFMKIGRWEPGVHLGFITNDPFLNRYLGGINLGYHITEVLAVEVSGTFSPDFGELDYKPVTQQIINENQVTPDISKIQYYATGTFQYSPIYGKVAVGSNKIIIFDIFGAFGTGVVGTADDLEALDKTLDPKAVASQNQLHPSLNYGGGLRVAFTDSFAIRVEGRGLSYIEVLESTTLEMKNNFTMLAGATLFVPGMK